jgi:protein-tyrosine phosphatase
MIDIHHHLLPGVDDGSKDFDNSVAMAKIAVEDGITHVACSPHANGQYNYDRERYEGIAEALRQRLAQEGVPLTVGLGCDFHMSYDNVQAALADHKPYSINGKGYVLVELPDYGVPRGLTETFYNMQVAGMTPILTHPERNPTLQADTSRLVSWLRGGLLIQVTAGSVEGKMGKAAEKMAHQLLANRWVHFLATDAHNTSSRPPRMSGARKIVEKKYGKDYAHALCVENPMAAYTGGTMPPQVEPLKLYENLEEESWLKRVLGKLKGAD